jgi:hypothetical protein
MAAAMRRPIERYVRADLLEPVGMTETYFSTAEVPPRLRATSYRRKLTPSEPDYDTDPVSGAGYLTSARDLARFAAIHLEGAARNGAAGLEPNALAAIRTPRDGAFYHRGWGTIGSGDHAILMSDGQVNGGEAVIMLAPAADTGVVVLTNVASDVVYPVALAALELISPGVSADFAKASAELEKTRSAEVAADYPPRGPWAASGSLVVNGRAHRLALTKTETEVTLSIDGVEAAPGKAAADDDGFATWTIACPKLLPTCIDGTDADATLALTRGGGGYDGVIAVDSRFGLFPYEVHLAAARPIGR